MASQALIKEFEDLLGKENVFSSEADRQSYSYDSAVLPPVVPAFALRPTTTEQLGICVKKLYDYGIPMTVRGAGTNLSGGTIPDSKESVVILTNGLNRILEINSDDLYAVVEPGVVTATFAAEVAKKNLFYPPDPGSQAVSTLAGNIAENAGGLRGLKYGVTKDYLMGLEFFDATGRAGQERFPHRQMRHRLQPGRHDAAVRRHPGHHLPGRAQAGAPAAGLQGPDGRVR